MVTIWLLGIGLNVAAGNYSLAAVMGLVGAIIALDLP